MTPKFDLRPLAFPNNVHTVAPSLETALRSRQRVQFRLCEQFHLFIFIVQISVEINRRYNLLNSSASNLRHTGPLLFRAARYVREWYQALRSIRILQSVAHATASDTSGLFGSTANM